MGVSDKLNGRISKIVGDQSTLSEEVQVKNKDRTFLGDFFREMTREIVESMMEKLQANNSVGAIRSLGDFEYNDQAVSTYVHIDEVDHQGGKIRFVVPVQTRQGEQILRKQFDLRTTLSDVSDQLTDDVLGELQS